MGSPISSRLSGVSIEVRTPITTPDTGAAILPPQEEGKRAVILRLSVSPTSQLLQLLDEVSGESLESLDFPAGKKGLLQMRSYLLKNIKRYENLDTLLVSIKEDIPYKRLVSVLHHCQFDKALGKTVSDPFAPVGETVAEATPLKLVLLPKGGV